MAVPHVVKEIREEIVDIPLERISLRVGEQTVEVHPVVNEILNAIIDIFSDRRCVRRHVVQEIRVDVHRTYRSETGWRVFSRHTAAAQRA